MINVMLYDSSRTPPHRPHHTPSAGAAGGSPVSQEEQIQPPCRAQWAKVPRNRGAAGLRGAGNWPVLSCFMFLFFPMSQKSEDNWRSCTFWKFRQNQRQAPGQCRGVGSGEQAPLFARASRQAAGFSPLNRRSGMLTAADAPCAPTHRVGAKRGRAAGLGPGDRAWPGEEGAGNAPSCVCTENRARAGISVPGAELQPGPTCSERPQGNRGTQGSAVGRGSHCQGLGGLSGLPVQALPLGGSLGWDSNHHFTSGETGPDWHWGPPSAPAANELGLICLLILTQGYYFH